MLKCICSKTFDSDKQFQAHKARCEIFKKAKSEYLESIKDDILRLHETLSVLSIISEIGNSEYVSHSSVSKKLKEWGVKTRTISESKMLDSVKLKTAETNIDRYGGTGNPLSSGSTAKDKRDQTVVQRYGATNIFGSDWFKANITYNDAFWIEKYGIPRQEVIREHGISVWRSYSEDEKNLRVEKASSLAKINCQARRGMSLGEYQSMIGKEAWANLSPSERKQRIKNYIPLNGGISKLETRLLDVLETMHAINRQKSISDGRIRKIYDAHIIGTNILVEINGDYWHANPMIYCSGDIISYPGGKILVDEIWQRDIHKKELAEAYGYKVITIWEAEINQSNDIVQLLTSALENI